MIELKEVIVNNRTCIETTCTTCDKIIYRRKDQFIKSRSGSHFCSKICHDSAQRENRYKGNTKFCNGCQKYLELESNFYLRANKKTYRARCKGCNDLTRKKWFPEYYKSSYSPEKSRGRMLLGKYGLSSDDYNKLLIAQNSLCAICRQPETDMINGKVKSLSVDHCDLSGIVRGLLCSNCNTMIGKARHDIALLTASIKYLEPFTWNVINLSKFVKDEYTLEDLIKLRLISCQDDCVVGVVDQSENG